MGQKTNANALRLGITTKWKSRWFAETDFVEWLDEDRRIRELIAHRLRRAAVSRVEIERTPGRLVVDIHTGRPGLVIGRGGSEINRIREVIRDLTGMPDVTLNAVEVHVPALDAVLMAQETADQLTRRVSVLRAINRTVQNVRNAGAVGVRVEASGRLGGAEMKRLKRLQEGPVPLQTLRADIDYGFAKARTPQGVIGVKVWINRGTASRFAVGRATEPKMISSTAARRQRSDNAPLVEVIDPALERLLEEEEEMNRRLREPTETPHFRP